MFSTTKTLSKGSKARSGERTCVGCRRTAPAADLLRVTLGPDDSLVVDWKRSLGGRGAHVCFSRSCIENATSRRSFERTLLTPVDSTQSEDLVSIARRGLLKRISSLLGAGIAARRTLAGTDVCAESIGSGKAALVFIATDFASLEHFSFIAKAKNVPFRVLFSKDLFGELLQQRPVGVVTIEDSGLAQTLTEAVDRFEALE